ncbi:hypothetical protein TPY_2526 [Sulfobacillus acidophilus TPY]|nr:hypothetical protein TPY_2526 [Sulfobacillus acidophilus TPY]
MEMNNPEALLRYQMAKIHTASTEELGLMLYEAALKGLRECQNAIRAQKWDLTVRHGRLAQDIFAGLAETVNPEHPHADTMTNLYLYCWRTVAFVQTSHRAEDLDPVIEVVGHLIDGLKHFIQGRQGNPTRLEETSEQKMTVNFSG